MAGKKRKGKRKASGRYKTTVTHGRPKHTHMKGTKRHNHA